MSARCTHCMLPIDNYSQISYMCLACKSIVISRVHESTICVYASLRLETTVMCCYSKFNFNLFATELMFGLLCPPTHS